jgi:hypothetical protein
VQNGASGRRVETARIEVPGREVAGLDKHKEPGLAETLMKDEEIGEEALTLLSFAVDGPILSYRPDQDPIIKALLYWGHLRLRRDRDPDYAMLHLTDIGRDAVLGRQKTREEFLPPKP